MYINTTKPIRDLSLEGTSLSEQKETCLGWRKVLCTPAGMSFVQGLEGG